MNEGPSRTWRVLSELGAIAGGSFQNFELFESFQSPIWQVLSGFGWVLSEFQSFQNPIWQVLSGFGWVLSEFGGSFQKRFGWRFGGYRSDCSSFQNCSSFQTADFGRLGKSFQTARPFRTIWGVPFRPPNFYSSDKGNPIFPEVADKFMEC